VPGSVVGALVLAALLPGYLFLQLTARYRPADHNPSALEEAALFATVGVLTSGLSALVVAGIWSDSVAIVLTTPAGLWTGSTVRLALLLTVIVFELATLGAVLAAHFYKKGKDVQSGKFAWKDALPPEGRFLQIALTDGITVCGQLHTYDDVPRGVGRDLVLVPPISSFYSPDDVIELQADMLIVNETQIHSIAVHELDN
jgi:hypothetical protein